MENLFIQVKVDMDTGIWSESIIELGISYNQWLTLT